MAIGVEPESDSEEIVCRAKLAAEETKTIWHAREKIKGNSGPANGIKCREAAVESSMAMLLSFPDLIGVSCHLTITCSPSDEPQSVINPSKRQNQQ